MAYKRIAANPPQWIKAKELRRQYCLDGGTAVILRRYCGSLFRGVGGRRINISEHYACLFVKSAMIMAVEKQNVD